MVMVMTAVASDVFAFVKASSGILALVGAVCFARPGLAQEYPTKTIRVIVPHSAGSGVDTAARQMVARLATKLGQQIVVENQPASNSIVGTDFVTKAQPDGYTLLFNSTQHTINPALFKSLPYDTLNAFTPVARVTSQSLLLAVPATLKVNTLQDFIEYAKKKPGLNYASTGTGSSLHLSGAYFDYSAKLKANHIPYKTAAQAISDLVRGDVAFMFYPYPPLKPHIDSGSLAILGVTGDTKPAFFPSASPMKDLGYPDFILPAWHAFYAPAKTPRPVIDKLAKALAEITSDPDTVAKLGAIGVDVYYAGPDELAKLLPQEIEKYSKIIDIAGVERQ
jgi:tripartite-type tricarboxylate transporter receptor subunit TctC